MNCVKICRACSIRQSIPVVPDLLSDTIWSFPFFTYKSQQEMAEAFKSFMSTNPLNFASYNDEGYTYPQWQIYYLSKNRHDYRALHRSVLHLFRIMSSYPFFKDMIRYGSKNDPLHHTLHHFTKYMDRVSYNQNEMLAILTENGLSLEDEDSDGMTPRDYLSNIRLNQEDLKRANELTRLYKERERVLFEAVRVRRCEICNDAIAPYNDLSNISNICNISNNSQIQEIMSLREECADIYRAYNSSSVARHQYVIDIYKSLV